jgi:hypothetical protein
MKRLLGILIAIMMTTISQASMSQSGNATYGKPTVTAIRRPIVIQNARVHVSVPRIPKFKLLRGNPYRLTHFLIDDSEDDFVDDEGIMTPYRRRDLTKIENPDGLSENIRWRLFLARQLALIKFRQTFG